MIYIMNLKVEAADLPGRRAIPKAVVEVRVENPSEADPTFNQDTYTFTVTEDEDGSIPATGRAIGTVRKSPCLPSTLSFAAVCDCIWLVVQWMVVAVNTALSKDLL